MDNTTAPAGGPTVPPAPAPGATAPGDDGFFDAMRRVGLVRTQDRWIGGVAGGVARRFGIDPLLVRGLLAVTVLLGGAGLVLYGLAWALLPEETDGRIHLQETIRGHFEVALLGAIAFLVIGFNRGGPWFTVESEDGFAWVAGLLWLAAIAAVIAMVVAATNQRRARRTAVAPMGTAWSAAAPPPPGAGRTVPHPGYGAVPYAPPAGGAWSGAPTPPPPGWSAAPAGSAAPPAPGISGGPGAQGGFGASGGPTPPAGPGGSGGAGGPAGFGVTAYRPAQPALPPPPPRPRAPRAQGPGRAAVGAVVGLTLLALAALLVLDREGLLGQPVLLTALGIGVVLAGLGIIVSGLRGRSSGLLGFLAIVGLVAAVPAAVVPEVDGRFAFVDGGRFGDGFTISTGETWTPATVAEAQRGISVGFGDLDVDLTEVPLTGGAVEVPIRMNAGDLRVVVPDDAAVTGQIRLSAGEVSWAVDGDTRVTDFSGTETETYASEEAADGDVDLAVRITAGAGQVRVVEED